MRLIGRLLKESANLWRFAAICAAFWANTGAASASAMECEDRMQSQILAQTRYFDFEHFQTQTDAQLRALLPVLNQMADSIHAQVETLARRIGMQFEQHVPRDEISMAIDTRDRLEEDERGVQRYAGAIKRALAKKTRSIESGHLPVLDLHITGKTDTEVMAEITSKVEHLLGGKSGQALRFFPNAQEDLVREYGTDLRGRELFSGEAWDEFGLEGILKERGLNAEDGFYAVPHELAGDVGRRENGEPIPFAMVQDFMRGARALAVYDMNQLEDFNADYFVFRDPAHKKKALLAIIRPRK